jgi:hypothetical protein
MSCLSSNHLLSSVLELNRTPKQVEDERQIDVLAVDKAGKFSNLGRFEVGIKLVTLKPGIVELIAHCACYLEEGIRPSISPNHGQIKIIQTVQSITGFFPTLRSECIVRKLKASVERVHIFVHS